MEGVGARLGRSSTRYGGPATVFSGPVRKWKKNWVPISNPNNNNSSNNNNSNNGTNNSSHLILYKWTPNSRDAPTDEPPRKRFRYVPIAVIEEQKQEEEAAAAAVAVNSDDESKPGDEEVMEAKPTEIEGSDEQQTDVDDVKEETPLESS